MSKQKCIDVLEFIVIILCLLLTLCEILSAFVIFPMEIYQIVKVLAIPFFKEDDYLFSASIAFLITSFFLCLTLILQWTFRSSKTVYILRNLANILFTAAAIYHLYVMRKTNEEDIFQNVVDNWSSESYGKEFQNDNHCSNLPDCMPKIQKEFDHIFKNGRGMKVPIALFWCSIIYYGLISVGILIFSKCVFHT